MMNRSERAAQQEASLRTKRAALKKAMAKTQAIQRAEARKQRDKRRALVGQMVEDAGLFAWSDADLKAVVQALSRLLEVSNPAAVVEGLLHGISPNGTDAQPSGKSRSHDSGFPLETPPERSKTAPCP
jgi:hypothetical protein